MKFIEQEIADDLKLLLQRGIAELKATKKFDASDVLKLEKFTRTYSILMADVRETVKHGLLSGLDDSELDELAESE